MARLGIMYVTHEEVVLREETSAFSHPGPNISLILIVNVCLGKLSAGPRQVQKAVL